MKKLLREPLLHFLVLGAALFALFDLREAAGSEAAGRLDVSAGRVEALGASFERTWRRRPTEAELEGIVEEWIRDEVLYREALARGLDRDDEIVRRRMRQKLEFVADDLTELVEPTDAELGAFLDSRQEAYRLAPRLALRHVYVSRDRHGDDAERLAGLLLEELRRLGSDADTSAHGDATLLPAELELGPLGAIAGVFGDELAAALELLEVGRWEGPLASSYGLHLVLVSEREEGRVPALDEIRTALERDWLAERRRELSDAFYARLRARWDVAVEWPKPTGDTELAR